MCEIEPTIQIGSIYVYNSAESRTCGSHEGHACSSRQAVFCRLLGADLFAATALLKAS
jgi:hypothetical protein